MKEQMLKTLESNPGEDVINSVANAILSKYNLTEK